MTQNIFEPIAQGILGKAIAQYEEDGGVEDQNDVMSNISAISIAISLKRLADAAERIAQRVENVTDHFEDGVVRVKS